MICPIELLKHISRTLRMVHKLHHILVTRLIEANAKRNLTSNTKSTLENT